MITSERFLPPHQPTRIWASTFTEVPINFRITGRRQVLVLAGRGRGAMTTVCSARRRVSPRDKALRSLLEKSQARLPREAGDAGPSTVGSHHLLIVLAATSHTVRERSTQRKARENAGLVDFGGLAQNGKGTTGGPPGALPNP